jgi:adenosylhomocysteine nucleosidase
MTGVIFATLREAAPFLGLTGQRHEDRVWPAFYANQPSGGVVTIISGMGPGAAGYAARAAIADHGVHRLVNAGICGALRPGADWMPGAVFVVKRVTAVDFTAGSQTSAFDCSRQTWQRLPIADLVTCDRPLFDAGLRDKLAAWGALVDMEGASVAAAARDGGVPCTLIKGITDFAAEGERAGLHRRLEGVSCQIAEILWAGLNQPKPESRGTNCPLH